MQFTYLGQGVRAPLFREETIDDAIHQVSGQVTTAQGRSPTVERTLADWGVTTYDGFKLTELYRKYLQNITLC